VERKPADKASAPEQCQTDPKSLQKRGSGEDSDVLLAQISKFTPISQPETFVPETTADPPTMNGDSAENKTGKPSQSSPAARQAGIRVAALLTALTPLTLLIIAGNLTPAKQGLGTHQQLGLPPCSMRYMFGIRCPACGMTTSWSYFAKGNWFASISTNAGGFLLALLCIAIIIISADVFRHGRLPSPRIQKSLTIAGAGIMIVTLLDWIARLQS